MTKVSDPIGGDALVISGPSPAGFAGLRGSATRLARIVPARANRGVRSPDSADRPRSSLGRQFRYPKQRFHSFGEDRWVKKRAWLLYPCLAAVGHGDLLPDRPQQLPVQPDRAVVADPHPRRGRRAQARGDGALVPVRARPVPLHHRRRPRVQLRQDLRAASCRSPRSATSRTCSSTRASSPARWRCCTCARPRRDIGALIDSAIIAIGIGTLSWVLLISPYAHDATLTGLQKIVSMGYPIMDLMVLDGRGAARGERRPAHAGVPPDARRGRRAAR